MRNVLFCMLFGIVLHASVYMSETEPQDKSVLWAKPKQNNELMTYKYSHKLNKWVETKKFDFAELVGNDDMPDCSALKVGQVGVDGKGNHVAFCDERGFWVLMK